MATSVSFNGATYSIPVVGERQWGTNVSNFLIAVAGNALSKAGGSFVLTTADVNFGSTYGLVTAYIKGAVGNIAASGVIRFANLDAISWRNAGNTADLALRVNASDRLQFGGVDIPTISSTDTLTGKTMSGSNNTFTNMPVGTTGVQAIANGGTAVSALPTTQSASAFAAWDANQNLSANNIVNDYATTATAAGTTTLTVSSKRVQFFTGSTTQTVVLPVASTLTLGHNYYIRNLSTGVVTIQSSGANTVIAMQPQDGIIVTCILASGTSAASWSVFSELANTSATGALSLPAGTAAQRPTAVAGQVRLNTDTNSFEGYANGAWSSIGGGLNELPQKNYLKTYSDAVVAPGTLSTLASTTANLVSLTAFYADATSGSSALTSDTSSTLRGTTNYLTAAGTASSTGARFIQFPAFALEGTDLGKPISISFDVSGVTADGNWDAVIVRYNSSGTHQSIISIAGNASSGTTPVSAKLPTGTTTFNGFFVPDSTTAGDLYALRLRHLVTNAAIRVDTLFIGPQPIRTGAAITDWQSYTPTVSNLGTGTGTSLAYWRRNGGNLELHITFTKDGSGGSGGAGVTFTIPTGLTIDSALIGSVRESVGIAYSTTATITTSTVARNSSPTVVSLGVSGGGDIPGSSFTAASVWSFNASVPIVGWSSNVTMADRSVEEFSFNTSGITTAGASDTTAFGYGVGGATIGSIASTTTTGFSATTMRCRFTTPIQPTDRVIIEFDVGSGGLRWLSSNDCLHPYMGQLSALYGAGASIVNATDVDVSFGNGGRWPSNASYGGSGQAWSGVSSWKWRVRKVSAGAQVGYPISSANIYGRQDGNAPATGMVGEQIRSQVGATTVTSAAVTNLTTIALTAGIWDISAAMYCNGTTVTEAAISISGTSTTHGTLGDNYLGYSLPAGFASHALSIPQFRVTLSGSATYYLIVQVTGTGTVQARGRISAIRIA